MSQSDIGRRSRTFRHFTIVGVIAVLTQLLTPLSSFGCYLVVNKICTEDYTIKRRYEICNWDYGYENYVFQVSYLMYAGSACSVPNNPQWKVIQQLHFGQCVIVDTPIQNGSDPVTMLSYISGIYDKNNGQYHDLSGVFFYGPYCATSSTADGGVPLNGDCNCQSDESSCSQNFPPSKACFDGTKYFQCGANCGTSCVSHTDY